MLFSIRATSNRVALLSLLAAACASPSLVSVVADSNASESWRYSKPDLAVYIPAKPGGTDNSNQHFQVVVLPSGTFLAMWTSGSYESADNQRIVSSRSTDQGRTWSKPIEIDGRQPGDPPHTGLASWAFSVVVPKFNRVYCFYNKNVGIQDVRPADTGALRAKWSDDDGKTWSTRFHDYPVGPTSFSNPDPRVPQTWIVYQLPFFSREGNVIAGFTRWGSPKSTSGKPSEVAFLHFENVMSELDPTRLKVTTYPKGGSIRLFLPSKDRSVIEEPTVNELKDGRYLCVMRTLAGSPYFSISTDKGRTWSEPKPLCYEPGGGPIENPLSPCPLYKLSDGRYFFVFYNNVRKTGTGDSRKTRTPVWYTVGREIPGHPVQPMRFGQPRVLAENDQKPIGNMMLTEIGTYPSFFECKGKRYFWYADKKHFLLGKYITDEMLAAVEPGP